MAFSEYLTLYLVLSYEIVQVVGGSVKRNNDGDSNGLSPEDEKMFSPDYWWESTKNPYIDVKGTRVRVIEEEILHSLNEMDPRQKHRLYDDLRKQKEERKAKSLTETDGLSPLNVVELKAVQRSIKTPNGALPTIRNKRTLNFLLFAVARAMGYALIPRNPDAEWLPIRSNPCRGPAPRPSPCAPPPPPPTTTTPPPPPPPTIPPSQIDANTIRYPYRPSQEIPLLRFAPLPPGVTVPYPPLLQWPCTPPPPPNPCAPPPKPPPPCATPSPPCTKPPPPKPCAPPPPPPPPCAPPPPPPPPCKAPQHPCAPPPPKRPPPPPPPSPPPPCNHPCPPPPPKRPPPPPPPPPKPTSTHTPLTLEYDHPVKIQIFNNARKFLPASGTVYSGEPSKNVDKKLEQYEQLDEEGENEEKGDYGISPSNIFREEENSPNEEERYEDGEDEVREELYNSERDSDDEEEVEERERRERYYGRRMVPEPHRKRKINANYDTRSKEQGHYKPARDYGEASSSVERQPKKGVLRRVIKIRKPITKRIDEYGNEYTFATSAVHEIRKRDLQDFDFIRKYKESQGELPEDEHYKERESPPGRTTTSIKKIEVKKFFVNKSEDDPVEYHEKKENNEEEPPKKYAEPEKQEEHEEEGEDERVSNRQFEPPEYEERKEMDRALEEHLRQKEEEEESPPPRAYDPPPPATGKGVRYVSKTITKYVGGSGGRETVKYIPVYKIIHAPPPPPPPPQVRKIVHHHHHRIPVYPKIVVRTGSAAKRRPPFLAHFGPAGNILLVTIRERNG